MRRHLGDFRLYALCMDNESFETLVDERSTDTVPISRADFEAWQPRVAGTASSRSLIEYYFTCSGALPAYVLEKYPVSAITSLDADTQFLGDPSAVFQEIGGAAIALVEHDFSRLRWWRNRYGRFNVGWVYFSGDIGLDCARRWRESVIDWCHDRVEESRFADQKYLDRWPSRYRDLLIIQNPGVNVGPWNVEDRVVARGARLFTLTGLPLVHYHFAGLRQLGPEVFRSGLGAYAVDGGNGLVELLYLPYAEALIRNGLRFDTHGAIRGAVGSAQRSSPREIVRRFLSRAVVDTFRVDA